MTEIKKTTSARIAPFALCFVVAILSGCYYDVDTLLYGGGQCDTTELSFQLDVAPVISGRCESCHSGNSPSGSVPLETFEDILVQVDNGQLLCTIKHENECSPMPKNGPALDECQVLKISTWIAEGAIKN